MTIIETPTSALSTTDGGSRGHVWPIWASLHSAEAVHVTVLPPSSEQPDRAAARRRRDELRRRVALKVARTPKPEPLTEDEEKASSEDNAVLREAQFRTTTFTD
jgi:type IV secretory pathway VirD2 relaxase